MENNEETESSVLRKKRIALVTNEAEKVFGSSVSALAWLNQRNLALCAIPMAMLDTDERAHEVLKVLAAISYGVSA